ncbi:MAG: hypothetical protein ABSD89_15745 [Halobacteriota archaeon]|jgi:hypothetical protein
MGIRSLVAACLCWSAIAAGQTSVAAKTYHVEDAYQIYNLLLPHEESYGFAKGTLIIQEETVSKRDEPCVTPEAASRFKDAIADYKRLNKKQWLLQRQFQIEKPYEIVSSDAIGVLFKDSGWDSFYKRYPDSGGYVIMSAVGFNKEKTRAVVFTVVPAVACAGFGASICLRRLMATGKKYPALAARWSPNCCKIAITLIGPVPGLLRNSWPTEGILRKPKGPRVKIGPENSETMFWN